MEPHPLLRYGPLLFVGCSLLLCSWLSKRTFAWMNRFRAWFIDRMRDELEPATRAWRSCEGQRVALFGVLSAPEVETSSLALEHAEHAKVARRLQPTLSLLVEDERLELRGALEVASSADELAIEEVRYERLYLGDRLHVVGYLRRKKGQLFLAGDGEEQALVLNEATIPAWRNPLAARSSALMLTILVIWGASSLAALALLRVPPASDALPGTKLDALVLAHAVPIASRKAKEQLTLELDRRIGERDRFSDPSVEQSVVLATTLDPDHGRATKRLADKGFRSRAGAFAHNYPSEATCTAGLQALAETLHGGAVQKLMEVCGSVPGDATNRAAFKMGDFMRAGSRESESIISRLPIEPSLEPSCAAGGYEFPPPNQPLCRLVHSEMRRSFKRQLLDDLALPIEFARRWRQAVLLELGDADDGTLGFHIDPQRYLQDPIATVLEQPIAVYEELRLSTQANLKPATSAWIRLAMAAERSAMGRHEDARVLVDEAWGELTIGDGASESETVASARWAYAIALRAEDGERAASFADFLPEDDALLTVREPELRLARIESPSDDLPLWLREGFPACSECTFFEELARLALRRDLAEISGDQELVADIEPILRRFEAVWRNRLLALSLKLAQPTSPPP